MRRVPDWLFWSAYAVLALLFVFCATGCSTANNYRLPPYEVQRRELTCDRTTRMPPGLVCYCVMRGSMWDCNVEKYP